MKRLRALAWSLALLLCTVSLAPPTAMAADTVDPALAWLRAQQQSDGGFPGFQGTSDAGTTADVALAFAAAGIDPASVGSGERTMLEYLAGSVESYGSTTGGAAKLALAAVASGANARAFGGADLIERIRAAQDPTTGLFDNQIFVHALAMLALSAADEPVPVSAIDALVSRQIDEGSWSFSGTTETGQGDSNTTSLAIQALAAAKAGSTAIQAGIGYLRSAATDSGAIVYQVGSEDPPVGDANSTALAVQAMLASGMRANEPLVSEALAALASFQNQPSGALHFRPDAPDDSLLATVQGIPALLQTSLPVRATADINQAAFQSALQPITQADRSLCNFHPETSHSSCSDFRLFWERNGGLPIFGHPISEEFRWVDRGTGQTITAQYYERARFEWHPDAANGSHIVLSRLGYDSDKAAALTGMSPQLVDANERCRDFDQTGQQVCGRFLAYWERNGGREAFGYPLGPAGLESGMTVQYFERARFEWQPGVWPERDDVLLGLLGVEALTEGQ